MGQQIDVFLAMFYSFVAVFYTVLIKRRSAQNCGKAFVHNGIPYRIHWWNHMTFRVMRILIWGFCISRLFFPTVDKVAIIFPFSDLESLRLIGVCILLAGFAIAVSGNLSLQSAWRSGIDLEAPEGLKKTGLYRMSRNPTYIGVLAGQVGFFLAIPSAFTLFCLIVGMLSINVQIYLEEQHLRERFKSAYQDYCNLVPRWLW